MPIPAAALAQARMLERQLAKRDQRAGIPSISEGVRYRISKTHGRAMVMVALVLDIIPLFVLLFVFFLPTIVGYAAGAAISSAANEKAQTACASIDSASGFWDTTKAYASCGGSKAVAVAAKPAGALVGAAANVFLAKPMSMLAKVMYALAGFVVALLGFLLFTFWFAAKGVFILAFTTRNLSKHILVMLATVMPPICTMIPAITFATWLHVRSSRTEDEERHRKLNKKRKEQVRRMLAYQNQFAYR